MHLALPNKVFQAFDITSHDGADWKDWLEFSIFFQTDTKKQTSSPRNHVLDTDAVKKKIMQSFLLSTKWLFRFLQKPKHSWNKGGGRLTRHGRFASLHPTGYKMAKFKYPVLKVDHFLLKTRPELSGYDCCCTSHQGRIQTSLCSDGSGPDPELYNVSGLR